MKKRLIRSALAVILVIALVLSLAGCGNNDSVTATTSPSSTYTPSTTVSPTEAPEEEVEATEAPEVVVDDDETILNTYGITFTKFDLTYIADGDENQDKDSMAFGLDIDLDNVYQEAYEFEIETKITAVTIDGSSLSKSKYSPSSLKYTSYTSNPGYYDAGAISDWKTGTDTETAKYYFEVAAAGVYTVEYKISVEHDKNVEYGYYIPDAVNEDYTITKTYVVNKAELAIETEDDAFQVSTSMFFVESTPDNLKLFNTLADGDYSIKVDVTDCDGTEVGEYTLHVGIVDDDENDVDPDDILFDNYYVTVSEGTRYILSADDVAKANVVRKMYYDDQTIKVTTEYSIETITYFHSMTTGQQVLAAVTEDSAQWASRLSEYVIADSPVSASAVEEAEYNLERDYILTDVKEAIVAYMTASSTVKKDAALDVLAALIISIDNEPHKYGSDLAYVLGNLSDDAFYMKTAAEAVEPFTFSTLGYVTDEKIVAFKIVEDEGLYSVSFGYGYNDEAVLNAMYDEYLTDWLYDYVTSKSTSTVGTDTSGSTSVVAKNILASYTNAITDQALNQDEIDVLVKSMSSLAGEYSDLLDYQKDLTFIITAPAKVSTCGSAELTETEGEGVTVEELYQEIIKKSTKIVTRWASYIQLVDSYGFEDTYIDNAAQADLAATSLAMRCLLGYNFSNSELASEETLISDKALATVLFAIDEVYATPDLFVDSVIEATEVYMQVAFDVQEAVDELKSDLLNYVISTGYYHAITDVGNDDDYTAALSAVVTYYVTTGSYPTSTLYLYEMQDGNQKVIGELLTMLTDLDDIKSAYSEYADAQYNVELGAYEMLDVDDAKSLDQIYTWIDYQVLAEVTYSKSSFTKDYEKNGIEYAIEELFEDIIEAAEDRIDAMAKSAKSYYSDEYVAIYPENINTVFASEFNIVDGVNQEVNTSGYNVEITNFNAASRTIDVAVEITGTLDSKTSSEKGSGKWILMAVEVPDIVSGTTYCYSSLDGVDGNALMTVVDSYFMLYTRVDYNSYTGDNAKYNWENKVEDDFVLTYYVDTDGDGDIDWYVNYTFTDNR